LVSGRLSGPGFGPTLPEGKTAKQPKRGDKMMRETTLELGPDAAGIAKAVTIWKDGGLVAFPTETVYGLGADATNGTAVAKIYAAKGRPAFNPLIIHVASLAVAREFGEVNALAAQIADRFWPGPLSMVLPIKPGSGLSELTTAGLDTVAIRVPQNPVARDLLEAFGGAIAAPSANPSGRISPTRAAHVLSGLSGKIDAVVTGGDCTVGLESTILRPLDDKVYLLRKGGIAREKIEAALGITLVQPDKDGAITSPGQLAAHYAPRARLKMNVSTRPANGLWLGFSACEGATLNLSPTGNLTQAAANLFDMLHQLDGLARQGDIIHVAPIPDQGLGAAINDRLKRAAS